ncbi:MAG: FAD binding domain-containing protein [Acidimicrobiia bacterium]
MAQGGRPLKPPRFSYQAPETTQQVVQLLEDLGSDAKILAGGQSLVPLLSFRLARPKVILDINRVPGLDYVSSDGDTVRIGALARHRDVELHDEIRARCPMIADAMSVLGHVAIRNRGTVVGSLAHADPSAEWPALAVALDAECTLVSRSGSRTVPAGELFEGFMTTVIAPDEMLSETSFRLPPVGAGSAFFEVARRHGDFAQAGAGVVLAVEGDAVSYARISLLGLGSTPLRATAAEDRLLGERPSDDLFAEIAGLASNAMEPLDDVHASAGYKRQVGTVMVRRALTTARARSGAGDG